MCIRDRVVVVLVLVVILVLLVLVVLVVVVAMVVVAVVVQSAPLYYIVIAAVGYERNKVHTASEPARLSTWAALSTKQQLGSNAGSDSCKNTSNGTAGSILQPDVMVHSEGAWFTFKVRTLKDVLRSRQYSSSFQLRPTLNPSLLL